MRSTLFCTFLSGLIACTLWAQNPPASGTVAAPFDKSVEVTPSGTWTDTGIDLHAGDVVDIVASSVGSGERVCDPQGWAEGAGAGLPLASAMAGSLIAKFQEKADTRVYVGSARRLRIAEDGRLYLGSNLAGAAPCAGKYAVKIHVIPGAGNEVVSIKSKLANAAQIFMNGQFGAGRKDTSQNQGMASDASVDSAASQPTGQRADSVPTAVLTVSRTPLQTELQQDLQSLPRRVNDQFENLGDMVNFVLIGSEKQVQDALTAANWHVADTSTPGAVAKAILMATQKQDYLQMPMSPLYLFGRVQDFGYEQAEPYAMVASRHHFRIWKSTLTVGGQPVWAGAGTHDIGFEKDQRNGKVTHKIDPKVDGERDHIGESLQQAGHARAMSYFLPSDPIQDARNATGGGYQSDGRVLVIFLQ